MKYILNKDDNILKSEALKLYDRRTLTLEYTKYKCIRFDKIMRKFVAKLLKYRILFKDILTFLGLDYRDASLVIVYHIVIGISTPKIR